jgi:DNA-directed RNA polymerase subunit RPC12/RpoP
MANKKKPPHWFGRTYLGNNYRIEVVVCSKCKTEFSYDAELGYGAEDYNYCPNCGTKMNKIMKPLCKAVCMKEIDDNEV